MLFDIGGVIVPLTQDRALARMASACGLPATGVAARFTASRAAIRYESGQLDDEAFIREICAGLGVKLSTDQFREIWDLIFDVEPLIPVEFFRELRRRYRMVLLSNTNPLHVARLRADCPPIACFDDAAFSFEVGCMKPDPRIFEEAVRRAGCAADECFYTDDHAGYVVAARDLGIDAVPFRGFESLRSAMAERGILGS
jgi:putative hydrolase of the HAD superfamily